MRLKLTHLVVLAAAALLTINFSARAAQTDSSTALVLTINGALTPAHAEYLERGLSAAANQNAELVILQLNTPGGAIDLMSRMVEIIRASAVPVVVYVTPRGGVAGSAGTIITLAGHLAAMAPETAIGAASPVGSEGEDLGESMEAKIKAIMKVQIRTLAANRPPQAISLAEDTVENAIALSAREAHAVGLIDILADDVTDLLRQLDGRTVQTAFGERTLNTAFVQAVPFELTLMEELLTMLTNPNIVFLLLTIGVQAILIELSSPGGWAAGFIGVISLALAAYGLGILPVNWFGLVFIGTAFVLFILDIKAPTHGALTAAGIGSFIAGALLLFNSASTPSFQRVSVPLVVVMALITAAVFFTGVSFAIRAQRTPVAMGHKSLLGKVGRVKTAIQTHTAGRVQLAGELWSAELADGESAIEEGAEVEVTSVDGLRLKVKRRT